MEDGLEEVGVFMGVAILALRKLFLAGVVLFLTFYLYGHSKKTDTPFSPARFALSFLLTVALVILAEIGLALVSWALFGLVAFLVVLDNVKLAFSRRKLGKGDTPPGNKPAVMAIVAALLVLFAGVFLSFRSLFLFAALIALDFISLVIADAIFRIRY
jgi:hypothetical protein